jgi:hypothetical protein
MGNRPIKDLLTLFLTFDYTQVNGLDGIPSIRIEASDDQITALAETGLTVTIDVAAGTITRTAGGSGDFTTKLSVGEFVNVVGTDDNDGVYEVTAVTATILTVTGLVGTNVVDDTGVSIFNVLSYATNGEIVLIRQTRGPNTFLGADRHKNYFIEGHIAFKGASDDRTIQEMEDELDSLMNVNYSSPTKVYDFEFENTDYNVNYQYGQIDFIVSATILDVSAIT